MIFIHQLIIFFNGFISASDKLLVTFFIAFNTRNLAAKVFISHSNTAVYKVAKCISKVGIKLGYKALVGYCSILCERDFRKKIVSDCIGAKALCQIIGIDNVTL